MLAMCPFLYPHLSKSSRPAWSLDLMTLFSTFPLLGCLRSHASCSFLLIVSD